MPAVALIASLSPCSVTLLPIVTVVPPIVSVPPVATVVVSVSLWALLDAVTCARASSLTTMSNVPIVADVPAVTFSAVVSVLVWVRPPKPSPRGQLRDRRLQSCDLGGKRRVGRRPGGQVALRRLQHADGGSFLPHDGIERDTDVKRVEATKGDWGAHGYQAYLALGSASCRASGVDPSHGSTPSALLKQASDRPRDVRRAPGGGPSVAGPAGGIVGHPPRGAAGRHFKVARAPTEVSDASGPPAMRQTAPIVGPRGRLGPAERLI